MKLTNWLNHLDTITKLTLIPLIVTAIWWCAVMDTRTSYISQMQKDIASEKIDIAVIKTELGTKTLSDK